MVGGDGHSTEGRKVALDVMRHVGRATCICLCDATYSMESEAQGVPHIWKSSDCSAKRGSPLSLVSKMLAVNGWIDSQCNPVVSQSFLSIQSNG